MAGFDSRQGYLLRMRKRWQSGSLVMRLRCVRGLPMPNPMMRFFKYSHLPPALQAVSKPIGDLAAEMDNSLPDSAEKTAGLRKLMEAKDCFVRAALPPETDAPKPTIEGADPTRPNTLAGTRHG